MGWVQGRGYGNMATFGNTHIGTGGTQSTSNNSMQGSVYTTPSDFVAVTDINFYCTSSGAVSAKPVIWLKSSNAIVTNGIGSVFALPGTAGWVTSSFPSAPVLQPNTEYVVGWVTNAANGDLYFDVGSANQSYLMVATNNYTTPANISSPTLGTQNFSIYINYVSSLTNYPGNKYRYVKVGEGMSRSDSAT